MGRDINDITDDILDNENSINNISSDFDQKQSLKDKHIASTKNLTPQVYKIKIDKENMDKDPNFVVVVDKDDLNKEKESFVNNNKNIEKNNLLEVPVDKKINRSTVSENPSLIITDQNDLSFDPNASETDIIERINNSNEFFDKISQDIDNENDKKDEKPDSSEIDTAELLQSDDKDSDNINDSFREDFKSPPKVKNKQNKGNFYINKIKNRWKKL